MKLKIIVISIFVIAAVISTYVTINTRLGSFIVMDVIGGRGGDKPDLDSENGPLVMTATLKPHMEIVLPDRFHHLEASTINATRIQYTPISNNLSLYHNFQWSLSRFSEDKHIS